MTVENLGEKSAYLCQCFTTASVESIIVPSISNNSPLNETSSAGALYDPESVDPIFALIFLSQADMILWSQ